MLNFINLKSNIFPKKNFIKRHLIATRYLLNRDQYEYEYRLNIKTIKINKYLLKEQYLLIQSKCIKINSLLI